MAVNELVGESVGCHLYFIALSETTFSSELKHALSQRFLTLKSRVSCDCIRLYDYDNRAKRRPTTEGLFGESA